MAAAALSALLALGLAGCTPEAPTPTPTPTPAFSNDDQAFAAAEATYRAYAAAENAQREDPASPDPQKFLIGNALEDDIASQRRFHELGLHLVGDSVVTAFEEATVSEHLDQVTAVICLDSTASRLIDAAGNDVTPADRDPTLALVASFVLLDGSFFISDSEIADSDPC